MANKEAIVFAIDVSQSMGKPVSDEVGAPTRLEKALEGVRLMVEAKMLQSKQNEVGVVLFGTAESRNRLHETMDGG